LNNNLVDTVCCFLPPQILVLKVCYISLSAAVRADESQNISTAESPDRYLSQSPISYLHLVIKNKYTIRNAKPTEFEEIGKLMVSVYSQLEGFPKQDEQPAYYKMLANIGELTMKPDTELLVAVSADGKIAGAVVYFSDMQNYGSGGTATKENNAAGFRLLAVDTSLRGKGIGKLLTNECIRKAKEKNLSQVIIHSTKAMQTAWKMYEGIGFKRSEDLDFMQGELPVFGFRLLLT
jgi:ribosomal protein S18 acetylase RimI-like enzyme